MNPRKFDLASDRRGREKRWVQRGDLAVQVDVEVVYPAESPEMSCLEPATVRWLDELALRAEAGDVSYLESVGTVYRAVGHR